MLLFVTLLPKKETKGSSCFRNETDLILHTLLDADGIVEKMEGLGSSFKTVEGRTVPTVEKLSFTVAGISAAEVRILLRDIEEQISLQGEGVRILISTTAPVAS